MTEIYMSHTQPVKDQRGQFSVTYFLTQRETLFVQLKCKLVSPLCIVNDCHCVNRFRLPVLITSLLKNGETFLPVIYYFLRRRAAVVNLPTITQRLTYGRRDKTKSKYKQSERLSKRDRQVRPSLAGLT
jgi:hypothetical protein